MAAVNRWAPLLVDDRTVVVLRHVGEQCSAPKPGNGLSIADAALDDDRHHRA